MEKKIEDFEYNQDTVNFIGNLPVKCLQHNVIEFLEKVILSDENFGISAMENFDLSKKIIFNCEKNTAQTLSEINDDKEIILYETYSQFLWSLTYSLISIYDECFKRPLINNEFNGKLLQNQYYLKGVLSLNYGIGLFSNYSEFPNYHIPNPLKYNSWDKFYIEKTNSIFVAAVAFCLLHEHGHQFFGHLDISDYKEEHEFDADEFAFSRILPAIEKSEEIRGACKYGAIIALISSIFIDETLDGGEFHPDPHNRLSRGIELLKLDPKDDAYVIPVLALQFWAQYYKRNFFMPNEVETPKELFELVTNIISNKEFN